MGIVSINLAISQGNESYDSKEHIVLNQVSVDSIVNQLVKSKTYMDAFEWHLVEYVIEYGTMNDPCPVAQCAVVHTDVEPLANGLMPALTDEFNGPVYTIDTYPTRELAESAMIEYEMVGW